MADVLIVNPTAGGGRAMQAREELRAYIGLRGIEAQIYSTNGPGHAREITRAALEGGADRLWAVGGDGTFNEIATEVLQSGRQTAPPLGIIPCGTGNDLSACLGVPKEPIRAFCVQQEGRQVPLDAWLCNERPFFNAAGAGFDAEALIQARRFKRFGSSPITYLMGVFATIATHRDIHVTLRVNGEERQMPLLMAVFANGAMFGGGIKVAPKADPHDGALEMALVHPLNKLRMPFELPKFLKGKQEGEEYVEFLPTEEAVLTSDTPMPVEADGEVWSDTRLHIRKAQKRLLVLKPL